MTTWLRNVDQFRRFDVADRNQNVLNARFNHGIGSALDVSFGLQVRDAGVSGVGVRTQREAETDVPVGGTQLADVSDLERLRVLLVSRGRAASGGLAAGRLHDGQLLLLLQRRHHAEQRDGRCSSAPGRDDAGLDPTGAGVQLAIALWDGVGRQPALPHQPHLGCVSEGSQHGRRPGLSLRAGRRPLGGGLHLFEGAHENHIRVQPHGAGVERRAGGAGRQRVCGSQSSSRISSRRTPVCRSSSGCPCACSTGTRTRKIRDWHYSGISQNPTPANNSAYLDFGPQDHKVHLFGALFRYEL